MKVFPHPLIGARNLSAATYTVFGFNSEFGVVLAIFVAVLARVLEWIEYEGFELVVAKTS